MGVNYARLRTVSAPDIISALIRDGFTFDQGAGSHQIFCHPDGRRVTVPFHGGKATFRRKTLKSVIETQAHWTESDLMRLKLVR
ncbi:MAG: type II toxin-antitoxin system HicA family toxin [Acidobacteria bacterium]|nr:type II toxin-antitoxin system HicA family toxin [Acidobacteriota bacterium]